MKSEKLNSAQSATERSRSLPKGDAPSLLKGDALSLPKGWEIKKLGEVCEKIFGKTSNCFGIKLLSLTINNKLTIERQGVNWQAKPQLISGQALDQMMLSWQQFRATQIKPIAELQTLKPNQQVKVILASSAPTITQLWVYFTDDGFYVVAPATGTTYLAPTPLYRQLFPFEVH